MSVKVIHWGLGAMGGGMAELIAKKSGIQSVGAIDLDPNKVGKPLGEIFEGQAMDVIIQREPEQVLSVDADLVLIATGSFTKEVFPQIKQAVESKKNVICIAEEMAYPEQQERELAKEIDRLAKEHNVTVLGTGINPGFVLDTLIIALTGVCTHVEKIEAARINDLSPFGPTVMKTQGVGTTVEEFKKGIEEGYIVGHVGFPESMGLIAKALGWELDEIKETKEPIISKTYRKTKYVEVYPGMVAGCKHIAYGIMDGKTVIKLEHPQQVLPELEGVETGDYINIYGTPNVNMAIKPEIPGGIGTIAMAVNSIINVIKAKPGLTNMAELPVPRAIMGDIEKMLKTRS
ncbi:4-hydroxy-tetrahydrodipicolinate reductase [Anaerobranca californiensis DSM 14826]|jgi:4-hydroxy-tetrahydrodipicolinate reductase|uniref:4-hydroxy-tetrahydrodipicolinate reductase n=1 Tax=Anaerobranca californiensis DSM 14826 TaxID=1120989 RepID=A0A1M6MYN3_9FIRM|nr:2,4-diaminopentanoate dehydrogenase [Anaerobranca californiensis]SHJ88549.1 4-hydroxy-tetrahydrodipicolinate reductase [Anaerobranca californiensis DSM 14826]